MERDKEVAVLHTSAGRVVATAEAEVHDDQDGGQADEPDRAGDVKPWVHPAPSIHPRVAVGEQLGHPGQPSRVANTCQSQDRSVGE